MYLLILSQFVGLKGSVATCSSNTPPSCTKLCSICHNCYKFFVE